MNLKDEINRYLNGSGYYKWGIVLLEQLQHDPAETAKLRKFSRDQYAPTWAEQRIETILRGVISDVKFQMSSGDVGNVRETFEVSRTSQSQAITQGEKPQVIVSLETEIKMRLKLRADWHAQMKATDARHQERKAHCAEQVLHYNAELEKRYILLNNYREHSIVPLLVASQETATDKTAAEELAALVSEERSVAPRVSKIKNILRGALPDKRREKLGVQLAEKEARLSIIRAKMQAIGST